MSGRLSASEAQRESVEVTRSWSLTEEQVVALVRAHWSPADSVAASRLAQGAEGDAFLVETGDRALVAKLTYASGDQVDRCLHAAQVVAAAGLRTSSPVLTSTGARAVLVEAVAGQLHPFSLMEFVPGTPLQARTVPEARLLGDLTGRIHAALLNAPIVPAEERQSDSFLSYVAKPFDVPSEVAWLPPLIDRIVQRVSDALPHLSYGIALWEGPEVLIDDDGTAGLIDWGLVEWRPLAAHVANQIRRLGMSAGRPEREAFLAGYNDYASLREPDLAMLPLLSALCLAVYVKFAVGRASGANVRDADRALAFALSSRGELEAVL